MNILLFGQKEKLQNGNQFIVMMAIIMKCLIIVIEIRDIIFMFMMVMNQKISEENIHLEQNKYLLLIINY